MDESRDPIRIVLAEDNAELRQYLAEQLRLDGHRVVEARDGRELLDVLAGAIFGEEPWSRPDVVISDVCMPGWSGLEIVQSLRRADWDMPVILITAFGDEHVHDVASRLGARVFDKPFDADDLRTAVLAMARR